MTSPLVLQQEPTECGLACLVMILKKFGSNISLEFLRKRFELSSRGTSIAELVGIAKTLHLKPTVYSLKVNQIYSLSLPAILYWRNNHYVVLHKIDSVKGFYILDPACGSAWFSYEDLHNNYSGYSITFQTQENYKPLKENYWSIFKNILSSAPYVYKNIWIMVFTTLLLYVLILLFPCYIQKLIDPSFSSSNWTNTLVLSFCNLIAFKACEAIMHLLRGIHIGHWERIFTEHLSMKMLKHLLYLPLQFYEKRSRYTIYSKFNAIDKTRDILSRGLAEGLVDGFFSILILIVIFIYSKKIGYIVCLLTMFYLFINYLLAGKAQKYNQIQIKERTKETSTLLECLRGIIPIKIFNKEEVILNRWMKLHSMHLLTANKIYFLQSLLEAIRILIFGIQISMVLILCLKLIRGHELSLGMLYALLFYINLLNKNTSSITSKWFDMKIITTHAEQLNHILHHLPEYVEKNTKFVKPIHTIKAKQVSFRYHSSEPWILQDINFEINSGDCVVIFGPSGYGKSTLLKILMGLLEPTQGTISVNDIPLQSSNLNSYRQKISAVMQDDDLFSGTICENISFFADQIDFQKVCDCAKLAGIAQEIEAMPMSYHSYIGEAGVAISGGQKQRILLARALYANPSILFLDEAFSNLDIEREVSLTKALKTLGITRVIITHRRESLSIADRVINLHQLNTYTKEMLTNQYR